MATQNPNFEIFNCEFNSPRTWENLPPNNKIDIWNYSEFTCWSEIIEKQNDEFSTSSFYLTKDVNYGDIFTIFFLTLFTLFFIFSFIYKFVYKIKVSFRR